MFPVAVRERQKSSGEARSPFPIILHLLVLLLPWVIVPYAAVSAAAAAVVVNAAVMVVALSLPFFVVGLSGWDLDQAGGILTGKHSFDSPPEGGRFSSKTVWGGRYRQGNFIGRVVAETLQNCLRLCL